MSLPSLTCEVSPHLNLDLFFFDPTWLCRGRSQADIPSAAYSSCPPASPRDPEVGSLDNHTASHMSDRAEGARFLTHLVHSLESYFSNARGSDIKNIHQLVRNPRPTTDLGNQNLHYDKMIHVCVSQFERPLPQSIGTWPRLLPSPLQTLDPVALSPRTWVPNGRSSLHRGNLNGCCLSSCSPGILLLLAS